VAADGSTHRGEDVLAAALGALLFAATHGAPPAGPVGVTYPAHWHPAAVDALRNALVEVPEFGGPTPLVVPDAAAALTALRDNPGIPTHGVIALCDFGGTGTSVTLVDAAAGYQPIGPTVRNPDFSGDLIDRAVLTHVVADVTAAGAGDLTGTSAIGPLSRLRGRCRAAKERLSTTSVTSLPVDLPGRADEVRLTRNELDDAIRQPLTEFLNALRDMLERNGIRPGELVAAATVGGGAGIPLITTMLSERLRVPIITTGPPELTAAIGGGLAAAHGAVQEDPTAIATRAAPVAAEPAPSLAPALAWSEVDDLPEPVPIEPYDYSAPTDVAGDAARPQLQFDLQPPTGVHPTTATPWYRRRAVLLGTAAVVAAAAIAALVVLRGEGTSTPTSTTTSVTTGPAAESSPPPPPGEPAPPNPGPETQTVTQQAPAPAPQPEAPQEPPPAQAPPPSAEPPPSTPPPPRIPTIPKIPPIPTIPGLPPFIPQPGQSAG
jgi:hypothetical protein